MRIVKHFSQFIIKILLQLVGVVILVPLVYLSLRDKRTTDCADQRLPKLFRWFDVGDEIDKKYGLNGDLGYQQIMQGKSLFRMRYNWLALRNPVNYFQHNVLGVKVKDLAAINYYHNTAGNKEVGDWHVPGMREVEVELFDGTVIWEHYRVYRYKFRTDKCFRVRMGWKLGHDPLIHRRATVQWCFVIQPWKTYKGA